MKRRQRLFGLLAFGAGNGRRRQMKIKSNRLNYPILTTAFVIYMLLLVWIIVLKFNSADNIQSGFELQRLPLSVRFEIGLVPLESFIGEIRSYGYPKEALANIACFIPFGIFVTLFLNRERVHRVLIAAFLLSVAFEIEQAFTGLGLADSTDVLMNCIGAEIGLFVPLIFKGERSDRFANVASVVCGVAAIPALTYAIATTILTLPMYKGLLW